MKLTDFQRTVLSELEKRNSALTWDLVCALNTPGICSFHVERALSAMCRKDAVESDASRYLYCITDTGRAALKDDGR